MDVRSGDTVFAVYSYVAETDEAINLVEGERLYILGNLGELMKKLLPAAFASYEHEATKIVCLNSKLTKALFGQDCCTLAAWTDFRNGKLCGVSLSIFLPRTTFMP